MTGKSRRAILNAAFSAVSVNTESKGAMSKPGDGKVVLAVDCMGGDHGPQVTLAACAQFICNHPDAMLLLVGQPDVLQPVWQQQPGVQGLPEGQVRIVAASEVVSMDDAVEVALRRKKDSSMRVNILG